MLFRGDYRCDKQIEEAPPMMGLLKDLIAVMVLIALLATIAWVSRPTSSSSAQSCAEFTKRLAVQQDHDLTPAQETHLANCTAL
jgi:hypothetical protein